VNAFDANSGDRSLTIVGNSHIVNFYAHSFGAGICAFGPGSHDTRIVSKVRPLLDSDTLNRSPARFPA
jgi:hypothetical protein